MSVIDVHARASFDPAKMTKVKLASSERMFFDLYCLLPGQEQRRHSHDDSDKVYLVMKGEATIALDGVEQVAGQGMAVVAPAGVEHGLRNASEERLEVAVFMAPPPGH